MNSSQHSFKHSLTVILPDLICEATFTISMSTRDYLPLMYNSISLIVSGLVPRGDELEVKHKRVDLILADLCKEINIHLYNKLILILN